MISSTWTRCLLGKSTYMLGKLMMLVIFLGLALTRAENKSTVVAPDVKTSEFPQTSSHVTSLHTLSPNLASISTRETNSSESTTELWNGTSQASSVNESVTFAPISSLTTIVTKLSSAVSIATTPLPASTTPQPSSRPRTSKPAPQPVSTKYQTPSPKATTTESGFVTTGVPQTRSHKVALYFFLPLIILGGIVFAIVMMSYLRKRIRLDKLRHQLLPMYNFDPQEGEDWETELLTEPRVSSHTPLNTTKPLPTSRAVAEIPKLRFSSGTVEV